MNNPFENLDARLCNIETLLLDLKNNSQYNTNPKATDELLTVKDTATFLSLSVPTVYGLISKGELPVMKRSKRCYFSKLELLNYLKAGRKQTTSEIEQSASKYIKSKRG